MQEEVNQEIIAVSVQTTQLTADVLSKMLDKLLNEYKDFTKNMHGKVSLKDLMKENAGAATIEINENNIKAFEKVARKYNIDFAVKKDKTEEPPKYIVFFKARDKDVMAQAFKEFVHKNEEDKNKVPIKEVINELKEKAAKMMEQVINKDKHRAKERDL